MFPSIPSLASVLQYPLPFFISSLLNVRRDGGRRTKDRSVSGDWMAVGVAIGNPLAWNRQDGMPAAGGISPHGCATPRRRRDDVSAAGTQEPLLLTCVAIAARRLPKENPPTVRQVAVVSEKPRYPSTAAVCAAWNSSRPVIAGRASR